MNVGRQKKIVARFTFGVPLYRVVRSCHKDNNRNGRTSQGIFEHTAHFMCAVRYVRSRATRPPQKMLNISGNEYGAAVAVDFGASYLQYGVI